MGHSRAIEAALRWSTMTEHTPGVPLGAWLADLPDERLIRLLELRPDLAQPPPGSIAALAARAQARQSVKAATDDLDFLRLAVLDALLVLQADAEAVPFAKLVALIGERAPEAAITEALDDLRDRALAWGDTLIRVATEAAAGLPWYPGQVVLEDPTTTPADITAQIEKLDAPERELLDRLLEGSPVGRTRDAAPGTPPDRPVQRLLAAGLLRQVDPETVILPRQVGQVLRGEEAGPVQFAAARPLTGGRPTKAADADAAAAGAVIDLLHEFDVVVETLGAAPVPELRSGGLGVRDMKRLTKQTGVDEAPAGPDPRNRLRGRADRQRRSRPRTGGRCRAVLGADGGRRPVRRVADRRALASAGHHLAGSAGAARPDRSPRPGRKTLCGAFGFALFDGGATRPAAAAGSARRPARGSGSRRGRRLPRDDLAPAAVVGPAPARTRRPPPRGGARAGHRRPRRDQHTGPGTDRRRRRRSRGGHGQGATRADRPLPAAGRPHDRGAGSVASRSRRRTRRRRRRRIRRCGNGLPGQRGDRSAMPSTPGEAQAPCTRSSPGTPKPPCRKD